MTEAWIILRATALRTVSRTPAARLSSPPRSLLPTLHPYPVPGISQRLLFHLLGVCLAYFESKFNPSAVYENTKGGYTGFGLFQIRSSEWCDHGKNLCSVSCSGGSLPFHPSGRWRLQSLRVWRRD